MKKRFLGLLLTMPMMVQAETGQHSTGIEVKGFEFEVKCGATYPFEKVYGDNRIGGSFGLEARWNMKEIPMDFGLEINFAGNASELENDESTRRLTSFIATTDYNFMRGQKFSPFAGAGLGWSGCDGVNGGFYKTGSRCAFMLRGGVEMFHHLRLTLNTRFAMKGYNHIGLTLGYAFGGGVKKKKMIHYQRIKHIERKSHADSAVFLESISYHLQEISVQSVDNDLIR